MQNPTLRRRPLRRSLLLLVPSALALVGLAAAAPARAQVASELSEEAAHLAIPRADLRGLSGEQRAQLVELSGDAISFFPGCHSTLRACLQETTSDKRPLTDKHPVRMARLAAMLLQVGYQPAQVIFQLEQYYGSFAGDKRVALRSDDCPLIPESKEPAREGKKEKKPKKAEKAEGAEPGEMCGAEKKLKRVTVVEFSDYQCPHCARALKPLHEMVEEGQGRVRLCSKYFPLTGHPRSRPAAAAAEYARAHGKFWEMNELLFKNQFDLEDPSLKAYAAQLGLNGDEMLAEVYSGKHAALIDRHFQEGEMAKVQATPSLFFNGRLHTLPAEKEFLRISVEDELEWQRNCGAWEKE